MLAKTEAQTGKQRRIARAAVKASWVAQAYAGLPFPTGPKRPRPARRQMKPNPRHLSDPTPKNKSVVVQWTDGVFERRYHFTKGYRWGRV